jgi:hypothetical protein
MKKDSILSLSEQQVLSLLRASLWSTPMDASLFTDVDWTSVLRLADQQTLAGVLSEAILQHGVALHLPQTLARQVLMRQMTARKSNARLNRVLQELDATLRADGICPVLLKGQGVATCYPQPDLRQCGDIDLYIGAKDYQRAVDLLLPDSTHSEVEMQNEKHYHMMWHEAFIEVHRYTLLLSVGRYKRNFIRWTDADLTPEACPTVRIGTTDIAVPPPTYNAGYIFAHTWQHFMIGGVGLRQCCDWILYLHSYADQIDRAALRLHLEACGLWLPWQIMSVVAVDYLGLPAAECPFYDSRYRAKADAVLRCILNEGNFGKYSEHRGRRPHGYFRGKLYNFCLLARRWGSLLRIVPRLAIEELIGYTWGGLRSIVVHDKFGADVKTVSANLR